jgi:hypothetical protein
MYMKYLSPNAIFLIVFLLVIVFLSAVLPPFFIQLEGFDMIGNLFKKKEEGFTEYSTNSEHKPLDSRGSQMIGGYTSECSKIFGFDGLFCQPSANKELDVMYNLPSNNTCESSGLTKSNGNVCLDKEAHRLLTTRGGNATGENSTSGIKDSIIG